MQLVHDIEIFQNFYSDILIDENNQIYLYYLHDELIRIDDEILEKFPNIIILNKNYRLYFFN